VDRRLPAGARPLLGFHEVGEDAVDARQVAAALGAQPGEHLRVKAYAYRDLARPGVSQAHHGGQVQLVDLAVRSPTHPL